MTYMYTGNTTEPDLGALHTSVDGSAMTDKTNNGMRWDEDTDCLCYFATTTLSAGDLTILDGIMPGTRS